jgi:ribosome biogenesis GTPase A
MKFRKNIIGDKPYAYVLNKADLTDLTHKDKIEKKLKDEGYGPCFFTVLKDTNDKETKKVCNFCIWKKYFMY